MVERGYVKIGEKIALKNINDTRHTTKRIVTAIMKT